MKPGTGVSKCSGRCHVSARQITSAVGRNRRSFLSSYLLHSLPSFHLHRHFSPQPFLYFSSPSLPLHHPFSPATPSSLSSTLLIFSLSLYSPLHTFLLSFRTFTPSSFPSTTTLLLSSPSPLPLPEPHTLLHSFSFTPPRSLPTYASLLLSTFSPTSFLPLSHSCTSFRPGLPSFPLPSSLFEP